MTNQPQQPSNAPLAYETIKKLIEQQEWVKIYHKRERVLRGLGAQNSLINEETQDYLQEQVMPQVYEIIDKFLVANSLSLVGYWNFNQIGATVVDKEQYIQFQQNLRREAPQPNWEKFEELLKELNGVKIVGAKNPATGEPTWTVQAQISDELAQKRSELLSLVEAVKSKFREFDTEEAKKNNPDLEQPQEEAPEQPETPQNDEEAPKQDETPVEQPEDQPEPAQEPQSDEQPQEPVEEPRQENQEQAPQSN